MIRTDRPDSNQLGNQSGQRLDKFVYREIAEHPKSLSYDTISQDGLLERYVKDEIEIHLHLRLSIGTEAAIGDDLCLTFKRGFHITERDEVEFEAFEAKLGSIDKRQHQVQRAVLVDVLKSVQQPKIMGLVFVPTVIGLRRIDDCLCLWTDAPDYVRTFGGVVVRDTDNRKLQTAEFFFRESNSRIIHHSEAVEEVVQGRTQVMQDIANDGRNEIGRSANRFDADKIMSAFRVEFVGDAILLARNPSPDLLIKRLQVLIRPL